MGTSASSVVPSSQVFVFFRRRIRPLPAPFLSTAAKTRQWGYALQTPPPSTMAQEPALCALPPRHASRNNVAAVTARRLLTRTCSSPPLPDQAVAVGLRCGTVDPQTLFSDREVAVGLRCGKAKTKTPRSFARLDPVLARDNSGRFVRFSIKEESTRLATSSPFSKRHSGKGPPRVKTVLPPARARSRRRPQGLRILLRFLAR